MATQTKYRSVTPSFKNAWGEGEIIEGKYVGMQYVDMKTGAVPKYTLDTEGGAVAFLGTVQLIDAFGIIPRGTAVRVTYVGETKAQSGYKVKMFNVEVAEGTELGGEESGDGQETLPF